MKEEIIKVKEEIQKHIEESKTLQKLEEIRVNYMGKKGIFTDLSKKMKDLTAEERPKIGQIINEVKEKISNLLDEKNKALKEKEIITLTVLEEKIVMENKEVLEETVNAIFPATKKDDIDNLLLELIKMIYNIFPEIKGTIVEESNDSSNWNHK